MIDISVHILIVKHESYLYMDYHSEKKTHCLLSEDEFVNQEFN